MCATPSPRRASNQPKGSFDGPIRTILMDANDQLRSVEEFRNLIIAYRDGAPLRLADVATHRQRFRRLGASRRGRTSCRRCLINVQRQPGANVIEVVDRVRALLPQLAASLPAAAELAVLTDRTLSIRASVRSVEHELVVRRAVGGVGRPSFSCATSRRRSSPASRCRCRSSARSA